MIQLPNQDEEITAAWARAVTRGVNDNNMFAGAGLLMSQGAGGKKTLSLKVQPPRKSAQSASAYAFKMARINGGDTFSICLPPGCLTYGTQVLTPEENLTEASVPNPATGSGAGAVPIDGRFGHCYLFTPATGELSNDGTGVVNCLVYIGADDTIKAAFVIGADYSGVAEEDKALAFFRVANITANGIEQVAHGGVALSAGGAVARPDRAPWAIKQDENGAFYFTNLYYRIGDNLYLYGYGDSAYGTVYISQAYANKILWLEVIEGCEHTPFLQAGTVEEFNARVTKMKAYAQVNEEATCCNVSSGACESCFNDRVLAVMPLYEFGDITATRNDGILSYTCEVKADLRPVPTGRIDLGGTSPMGEDKGPFKLMTNSSGGYTIYDCYYQVGGYTGQVSSYDLYAGFTGLVYLAVPASANGGYSAYISTVGSLSGLDQTDMSWVYLPIYEFVNGKVTMDFRRMPTTGIVEWYGAARA